MDAQSAQLWEHGAIGVEELDGALRAAFTDATRAAAARDRLAPQAVIETVDDTHGLDAARDLLTIEVAGGFAVHPPWLDPPTGSIGIAIDPGHAFGSGSHPSTRLALDLIGTEVRQGQRVLDIGCGTGVLSIAAALVGAGVVAVDIDPAAVDATIANVARNGVADSVAVRSGSVDPGDGTPYDLVVVNVTIDIHEHIAGELHPAHPRLIVAGILGPTQLDRCAAAYGATTDRHIESDGWMAAVLTRS
ncbi:MAG: 50S ribosomal protein L11 methyltransferase [Acidimicrobiales bacterium]